MVYLEHAYEGSVRQSPVLSWQTVLVPVRQSVINAGMSGQDVALGVQTIAIVALYDVAGDFYTPFPVILTDKNRVCGIAGEK